MESQGSDKTEKGAADAEGLFALISSLGVLLTGALFIWFFKAYIYDSPIVTTFLDAGMLFSPHERLLIYPIAVITLGAALLGSWKSGRSMIRPGVYIPAVVLIFLGLLQLTPVRRGVVHFYFTYLDSDISRIEKQTGSIFHPAYGDILLANLVARARIKKAAEFRRLTRHDRDEGALVQYALARLEGKSALRIATHDVSHLENFLTVLRMESESPKAAFIKAPRSIAPPVPELGFHRGFIRRDEARVILARITSPAELKKAGFLNLIRMRLLVHAYANLVPNADRRLVNRLRSFFDDREGANPRIEFFRRLTRFAGRTAESNGTVALSIHVAPADPKRKLPKLSKTEARKAILENLAILGYKGTRGKALVLNLTLGERWVATKVGRKETTSRTVQKRYSYSNSRDPLRYQTYTQRVESTSTVMENASLRLPVMTIAMSAGEESASIQFRSAYSRREEPLTKPRAGTKLVDALSARDCLRYGILCFDELTTRRISLLHSDYTIDTKAVHALPARR